MAVYISAHIDITDPAGYLQYGNAWSTHFGTFSEQYGGEFLVASDEPEVLEGSWRGRLVIMRFPDQEKAQAWYHSPEYREMARVRQANSTATLALHPAFDMGGAAAAQ